MRQVKSMQNDVFRKKKKKHCFVSLPANKLSYKAVQDFLLEGHHDKLLDVPVKSLNGKNKHVQEKQMCLYHLMTYFSCENALIELTLLQRRPH